MRVLIIRFPNTGIFTLVPDGCWERGEDKIFNVNIKLV